MKASINIKSWIWPALLGTAVLYGFVLRGSDVPYLSLTIYAAVAGLGAVLWLFTTHETPMLGKRPEMKPLLITVVLLIAVLSVLPVLQMQGAGAGLYDPSGAYVEYIKLGGLACAFLAAFRVSQNDEAAKKLLDALLIMGGVWALVSILMFIADPNGVYGVPKWSAGRLTGAFSSANSAGTVFGCISVVALGRLISRSQSVKGRSIFDRLDPVMLTVCVLSLAALSMSLSRGAITATLISMVVLTAVLLWRRVPVLWLFGALLVAVILVIVLFASPLAALMERFGQVDSDSDIRATIFKAHYDVAMQQPWFGAGLGSFNTVNDTIVSAADYREMSIIRAAHNVYLQWFEEAGIVGLVVLAAVNLAILVPMFQAARRRERMGGRIWAILFGYLVFLLHGFTDYAFQEPALTVFVAILLGCGFAMATNSARLRR